MIKRMQRVHATRTCNAYMPRVYATCICNMYLQHATNTKSHTPNAI